MMMIMRLYFLDIGKLVRLYVKLFVRLPGIPSEYDGTNWREDYRGILVRSGKSLDVKLLLSALQQSLEFEYYLEKRFSHAVTFPVFTRLTIRNESHWIQSVQKVKSGH